MAENREYPPHVQRMVLERYELYRKEILLGAFIEESEKFKVLPPYSQTLAREQLRVMTEYREILEKRIYDEEHRSM